MSLLRTLVSTPLCPSHRNRRRRDRAGVLDPLAPTLAARRGPAARALLATMLVAMGGCVGLSGCDRERAVAEAELARVEAACAQGDPDAARTALTRGAEQSRLFANALEDAKANWGGAELAKVNPCGLLLEDLRRRLPHQ